MAPPTQAGKFKPRKPAKAINVGAQGAPIAVPSNSAAAAAASGRGAGGGSSRPARGGGRGRGRDGGRGGRFSQQQQQGQVFFTGNSKPDAAKRGSAASGGSSRASGAAIAGPGTNRASAFTKTGSSKPTGTDVQEEVVEVMEEGVGSSRIDASTTRERNASKRYEDLTQAANAELSSSTRDKPASAMDRFMYDSDSSEDETRPVRSTFLQPIQLPIPRAIESPAEVASSASLSSTVFPVEITSASIDITNKMASIEAPPFATADDLVAIRKEIEGFFLCQLPTRLVPFQSANADFDIANPPDASAELQPESIPHVSVPSIQDDSFDNVMTKAEPGRLGRILVYKSGKTVLELTGPTGHTVRMNVSEGLSCGFRQYVACIDAHDTQLVTLGNVHKTVVVTPNLDQAML